jgi:hypothetical protein
MLQEDVNLLYTCQKPEKSIFPHEIFALGSWNNMRSFSILKISINLDWSRYQSFLARPSHSSCFPRSTCSSYIASAWLEISLENSSVFPSKVAWTRNKQDLPVPMSTEAGQPRLSKQDLSKLVSFSMWNVRVYLLYKLVMVKTLRLWEFYQLRFRFTYKLRSRESLWFMGGEADVGSWLYHSVQL